MSILDGPMATPMLTVAHVGCQLNPAAGRMFCSGPLMPDMLAWRVLGLGPHGSQAGSSKWSCGRVGVCKGLSGYELPNLMLHTLEPEP